MPVSVCVACAASAADPEIGVLCRACALCCMTTRRLPSAHQLADRAVCQAAGTCCSQCGLRDSSQWVHDGMGGKRCNSCQRFYNKHGRHRTFVELFEVHNRRGNIPQLCRHCGSQDSAVFYLDSAALLCSECYQYRRRHSRLPDAQARSRRFKKITSPLQHQCFVCGATSSASWTASPAGTRCSTCSKYYAKHGADRVSPLSAPSPVRRMMSGLSVGSPRASSSPPTRAMLTKNPLPSRHERSAAAPMDPMQLLVAQATSAAAMAAARASLSPPQSQPQPQPRPPPRSGPKPRIKRSRSPTSPRRVSQCGNCHASIEAARVRVGRHMWCDSCYHSVFVAPAAGC